MPRHGVFGVELPTTVAAAPAQVSGLPFVIGVSPINAASDPAAVGKPVLIRSLSEFRQKFGYAADTEKYGLCEFAQVFFSLYGQRPMIAVNLLDPTSNTTTVAAADIDVVSHVAAIDVGAVNNADLVVKTTGGSPATLVKDTDYSVVYTDDACNVVLLSTGSYYAATALNIAYKKVNPSAINATAVVTGLESIELCATNLGRTPDVIVAPGYSQNATVAAAMAQKAAGINGMFRAIAIVDIDTSSASTVANAISAVTTNGLNDKNLIVCWPMVKVGDKKQYLSSHMAARIAMTDAEQGNIPSRSPSNQVLAPVEGLVVASGTAVEMTIDDANDLEQGGIVTAINFKGVFRSFGNYTGDASAEDVKDKYINFVRMFAYVNNMIADKLWEYLDEPLTYRLVDSLVDEVNMSLNGLVGIGALYGARAEFLADENPIDDLKAGKANIHVYICPIAPFMEATYYLQYDASYARDAFAGLEI